MVSPETVSLQKENFVPQPQVYVALGMAVSYYTYSLITALSFGHYLLTGLAIFFAVIICLLRAVCCFPSDFFRRENIYRNFKKANLLFVSFVAGFCLGMGAGETAKLKVETGLPNENIIAVSGILMDDPRSLYSGSGLGSIDIKWTFGSGGLRASAGGNLPVFFPEESIPRLKEFGRGCEIYAEGKLVYGSRGLLFSASSLHITKPASVLEQFRTGLRMTVLEKFRSRGEQAPVWGSLASALLLGVRDNLDVDMAEGFARSGSSHILALSGMHLTIISALLAFLLKRPLGLRPASLVGAIFIIFYIFVAGSQPSLVRAGIMYLLGTAAIWGFLKIKALSLLAMAFIIQLLFQPETGVSYSFILSYLSLAGILSLGEIVRSLLRGRIPSVFAGSFSASIGAFVVTSPVVTFFFGALRPVGIIACLFLAPVSSLFMVFSIAALAASFFPLPLWNIFDLILGFLYNLLEFIVSVAGNVPGIEISTPVPVLFFAIIFCLFILLIKRKDSKRRDSIASFD